MALYYKRMEPFKNKLLRWILHDENKVPESILETNLEYVGRKLPKEIKTGLISLYSRVDNDKDLYFGITRKFLWKTYKVMGMHFDKMEK